jgi:xanthine dehydrogenase YagR molybdenum-binding subunit
VVQSDMTDIGTGTYTILTQAAADCLGLPMDRVRVELGRSEFPASWGSGGSWGAANSSNAVRRACEALREKLRTADGRIPAEGLEAEGDRSTDGTKVTMYAQWRSIDDYQAMRQDPGDHARTRCVGQNLH